MSGETGSVITRLENELRDIWSAPVPRGELPKSRACTMNLIVIADSPDLAARYTPVVDEVTSTIPARAIVVGLDPSAAKGTLEGDATAVCTSSETGAPVCSERVRLVASGHVCARVASAVLALCVPEIPTALVWLGRVHEGDPMFTAIASGAQRIILDTEYTSLGSLLHLARWTREGPGRPKLADLAWTRLSPWQEMCARFFDEPRLRALAKTVTRVSIKQASDAGAALGSEGALLLGWLATSLGWKTVRVGAALRFVRPDGQDVRVDLGVAKREEGAAACALAAVEIEAAAGGLTLRGSIVRDTSSETGEGAPSPDVLVWQLVVEGASAAEGARLEQRVRLGANKAAKVLERTLHREASDETLLASIAFAEHVVDGGITCG